MIDLTEEDTAIFRSFFYGFCAFLPETKKPYSNTTVRIGPLGITYFYALASTFGAAARISSLAPSANCSKFLLNLSARLFAFIS